MPWTVGVDAARNVSRGLPRTAMGWEIEADGLRRLLVRLHTEYPGTPLVITENGSAWDDTVGADGEVDDPERVEYLRDHLAAAHAAIEEGVDLRGYLAWSLLDNFEWSFGYASASASSVSTTTPRSARRSRAPRSTPTSPAATPSDPVLGVCVTDPGGDRRNPVTQTGWAARNPLSTKW